MAKSNRGGKRKGAGRPSIGKGSIRQLRMLDSQVKAIMKWAKKQPDKPTFSESVRRLVNYALDR